jgi:hypothetical protein
VTNAKVAWAGGVELSSLRQSKDKTLAMRVMSEGLSHILSRLHEEHRLDGVCGMGGTGGPTILAAGVRELLIGIPKLLISTVAAGDVSAFVGSADVTLMHSVVDVAGLVTITQQTRRSKSLRPARPLVPVKGAIGEFKSRRAKKETCCRDFLLFTSGYLCCTGSTIVFVRGCEQ